MKTLTFTTSNYYAKIFFLFVFLASYFLSASQNKWLKSFGGIKDNAGMFQGSDGFLYLVGRKQNGVGGGDIGIIKCDLLGNVIWSKNFGGAGNDYVEPCMNVVCEMNGRFTIVGTTASAGAGDLDILCFTIDSNGNLIRQKVIGGASNEMAYTIQKNSTNDGFVIGGAGYTGSFGANDHLILRTDTLFNITYSGHYGTGTGETAGKALLLSNGNILINGITNNGPNPWDGNLILCNSAGTVQWAKYITGTGYNATETYDNNILSVGSTSTSAAGGLALEKIDQTGTVLLSKSLAPNSYAQGVLKTSDGGYALLGSTIAHSFNGTNWNVIFIKLDVNLNIVWSKIYGLPSGDQQGLSFIQKSDGGFLIAATSNIAWGGTAANEVVFISTDNLGNTTCDFASRTLTTSNFTPTQASSGSGALVSLSSNNSSLSLANLSLIQNYPCGNCGGTFQPAILLNGQETTTNFCQGDTVALTATNVNSYLWNNTIASSSLEVNSSGMYTLQSTDSAGCFSKDTVSIVFNPLPIISSTVSSTLVCSGTPDTLFVSGAQTYTWLPGNLIGDTIIVNPISNTTYTVIGVDSNGCTGTTTQPINVNPLPNLSVTSSSQAICLGDTNLLSVSGAQTYTWMPGNLSGDTISVSPLSNTIYAVTGVDSNGCLNSATQLINVNPLPILSVSSASQAICLGDTNTLNATGASTYTWLPGNLNGSSIAVNPSTNTTYTVIGIDTNSCSDTATLSLFVNDLPNADISSISATCLGASDGQAQIIATGGTIPYTYLWSNGNNSEINNNLIAGNYTVTIIDANDCNYTTSIIVNDGALPCFLIPSGFSPNGDGINDTWEIAGIEKYPNATVTVLNRWGQEVLNETSYTSAWNGNFNGALLPTADYYYIIKLDNNLNPLTGTVTIKR